MPVPLRDDRRNLLRADCTNCFGLCCAALAFERSADFALSKPAGEPCVNLTAEFRCGIHDRLRSSGFKGCTVFDCFGAGQRVAQSTYAGVSWRDDPGSRAEMFAVFPIVRDLHELLWYVAETESYGLGVELLRDVESARETTLSLVELGPSELLRVDVDSHRATVAQILGRVSQEIRSAVDNPLVTTKSTRDIGPRGNLLGRSLARMSLRGADLRGALLIAADLTGSDLTATNLIGADLRDARLHGADLSRALFLTQRQVNSALGDRDTALPAVLQRPQHWG